MERIIPLIVIITTLFILETRGEQRFTEIVLTDKGYVRGVLLKTVQNSVEYSAFKGIPYGKPPLGYLRFKAPIEADSWDTTVDATSDPERCPQFTSGTGHSTGNEDCLYLNVYTPKTKFNSTDGELSAVMVWIHGGGFYEGSINSSVFGPDFLIEDNVVIVAMNYRLGALGFLSLNHPNASGNAGLKDQVLALKWVQKNIQNFGGDPAKVTIFGHSAGGAAVELHKVSDQSAGLFRGSIAMSGSPLNPWGFATSSNALSKAIALGKELNLTTTNVEDLLRDLYDVPAEDLVMATFRSITGIDMGFIPTVENRDFSSEHAFITECPIHRYKSNNYVDLPHMLGMVSSETIYLAPSIISKVIDFHRSATGNSSIFDVVSPDIIAQSIAISSDLWFIAGIDRTQQYLSQGKAPVYYYRNSFDYDAALHKIEGFPINGTAHSDDLAHLFWMSEKNQSLDPTSDIAVQRRRLVRLWTNFAKFGNPTPNVTEEEVMNIQWAESGVEGRHLEISNEGLKMGPRPVDIFVKILGAFLGPVEETLNGCLAK
ncbi:juvenile hormone esterase-like [Diachasmimorpha longicaudata]|uniref:juvenile hormone esterase-like n=1 Tax=Diachasmimorpha longicaudata TaxID=58733 RepID=UPI0030B8701A